MSITLPRLSCLLLLTLALAACPSSPPSETLAIRTAAFPAATMNVPYAVALEAQGGTGDLAWSLASGSLPAGIELRASGMLQGTPTVAGAHALGLRVRDGQGTEAHATLLLEVAEGLLLQATELPRGAVGQAYAVPVLISGGKAPYTLAVVEGALPPGLQLEQMSIAGTPTEVGTATFTLQVTDAAGRRSQTSYTLTVIGAMSIATSVGLPDAYLGEAYAFQLEVSGTGAATWSVSGGLVPAGVSLAASGALSGTPTVAGSFSFTVRALRGAEEATGDFTLQSHQLPTLKPATLTGDAGAALSLQLVATGGKAPLVFSTTGALPAGLDLSGTGLLSGTPVTAGAHAIDVVVTDANGRTGSAEVSLDIAAPLQFVGTVLPPAWLGEAYSTQLEIIGGRPPFAMTLTHGALPRGLNLSTTGVLSGHGALAGTKSFGVRVTDAGGRTASADFTHTTRLTRAELSVASWNIDSFPRVPGGPHAANVHSVLQTGAWDVVGLVEVVNAADFHAMVGGLSGYSGLVANDLAVTNGAAHYAIDELKPAVIWKDSIATPTAAQVRTEPCPDGLADAWAGRPPLEMVFAIGPENILLHLFVVHLKAGSTEADRHRRAVASACLKTYMDALSPNTAAMIVGEFNDDVDQSISMCGATRCPTPFANFAGSSAQSIPTAALSAQGLSTSVDFPDTTQHVVTSGILTHYLVPDSVQVIRPDLAGIADYKSTTSDRYPVVVRYDFNSGPRAIAPHVFINEVRYTESSQMFFDSEFVELINAGNATADLSGWILADGIDIRHVFPAGTQLLPGEVIVVFGGSSGIPPGLTNAMVASTGTLSLHPLDSILLADQNGFLKDRHDWTSDLSPGDSANRNPDGVPGRAFAPHSTLGFPASPGKRANGSAW